MAEDSFRLTRVEVMDGNDIAATLNPSYNGEYKLVRQRFPTQETDYYVNPAAFTVRARARQRDNTSSPWYVPHTNTYVLARLPSVWHVDQVARVGGRATIAVNNVPTLGFSASISMQTYPVSRLRATETLPAGALNPFYNGTTADNLAVSADTLETKSAQGYINVRFLGNGDEWYVYFVLKGIADQTVTVRYVYTSIGPPLWTQNYDQAQMEYDALIAAGDVNGALAQQAFYTAIGDFYYYTARGQRPLAYYYFFYQFGLYNFYFFKILPGLDYYYFYLWYAHAWFYHEDLYGRNANALSQFNYYIGLANSYIVNPPVVNTPPPAVTEP